MLKEIKSSSLWALAQRPTLMRIAHNGFLHKPECQEAHRADSVLRTMTLLEARKRTFCLDCRGEDGDFSSDPDDIGFLEAKDVDRLFRIAEQFETDTPSSNFLDSLDGYFIESWVRSFDGAARPAEHIALLEKLKENGRAKLDRWVESEDAGQALEAASACGLAAPFILENLTEALHVSELPRDAESLKEASDFLADKEQRELLKAYGKIVKTSGWMLVKADIGYGGLYKDALNKFLLKPSIFKAPRKYAGFFSYYVSDPDMLVDLRDGEDSKVVETASVFLSGGMTAREALKAARNIEK